MEKFDLQKIIEDLSNERKIFNSEADFQFALAWKIKSVCKEFEVFLEYYIDVENDDEKKMYVDIMLKKGNYYIPIELKYRKKKLKKTYHDAYSNQSLTLTEQSAQDQGRYWFLYDVKRIELIKKKLGENYITGYTVFLTNDKSYIEGPKSNTKCYAFRLTNDREIKSGEDLDWAEDTAKSSRGNGNFSLNGTYKMKWKGYSSLEDSTEDDTRIFNYLMLEIK